MTAALGLYHEAATLADQLDAEDIAIGALAGAGICSLRLNDVPGSIVQLTAAEHRFAGRSDWWFQGRERFESLVISLHVQAGRHAAAMSRFRMGVDQLEEMNVYAAAWLVAECAAAVAEHDPTVWTTVQRLADNAMVQQFVPLSARFTALRDIAERLPAVRFAASDEAALIDRASR